MLIDVLNNKHFHNRTLSRRHASSIRTAGSAAAAKRRSLLQLGKVEDDDGPCTSDLVKTAVLLRGEDLVGSAEAAKVLLLFLNPGGFL